MTTVYRLPEEPPVGTTVRPEPDTGERWKRRLEGWSSLGPPVIYAGPWATLLACHPGGLVVVEPDPHPTPWRVDYNGPYITIHDANGDEVFEFTPDRRTAVLERIVKAVNEATT